MPEMYYPLDFPQKLKYDSRHLSGPMLLRDIAEGVRTYYSHLSLEDHWNIAIEIMRPMIQRENGACTIKYSYDSFVKEGIEKAKDLPKSELEKLMSKPLQNKGDLSEQKTAVA